jgi:hypothetical protein
MSHISSLIDIQAAKIHVSYAGLSIINPRMKCMVQEVKMVPGQELWVCASGAK